jgi:hypothetical protein
MLKTSHKIKNQTDFWPEQVETGRYSAPSKLHIRATTCQTNEPLFTQGQFLGEGASARIA